MNPKTIFMWVAGSLAGGGLALTILGFAMQFWISSEVSSQLKDKNIVPKATVTALETRIEGLEEIHDTDVSRVDKTIERADDKIERIATILMED